MWIAGAILVVFFFSGLFAGLLPSLDRSTSLAGACLRIRGRQCWPVAASLSAGTQSRGAARRIVVGAAPGDPPQRVDAGCVACLQHDPHTGTEAGWGHDNVRKAIRRLCIAAGVTLVLLVRQSGGGQRSAAVGTQPPQLRKRLPAHR